jgi:hypothetical protein
MAKGQQRKPKEAKKPKKEVAAKLAAAGKGAGGMKK